MRKVTEQITTAFLNKSKIWIANNYSTGDAMYLYNNKIAEHREDGLWITNCGYQTKTTKERLNALPGVSIQQKAGVWYLNGQVWDGSWIKI